MSFKNCSGCPGKWTHGQAFATSALTTQRFDLNMHCILSGFANKKKNPYYIPAIEKYSEVFCSHRFPSNCASLLYLIWKEQIKHEK